jgi:hypothetical protein
MFRISRITFCTLKESLQKSLKVNYLAIEVVSFKKWWITISSETTVASKRRYRVFKTNINYDDSGLKQNRYSKKYAKSDIIW